MLISLNTPKSHGQYVNALQIAGLCTREDLITITKVQMFLGHTVHMHNFIRRLNIFYQSLGAAPIHF